VKISRAFKSKRLATSAGVLMTGRAVALFVSEFELCSFSVLEFVGKAGRRGDKVPKVGVDKSNQSIGADAWGRTAVRLFLGMMVGASGLRVELAHPR
jgi:hypothetical protein